MAALIFYKHFRRRYYSAVLALLCGAMMFATGTASAQEIGAAHGLTAVWSSADTVTLQWGATGDSLYTTIYTIYATKGSVQATSGDAWHLVKTQTDTSATLSLSDLKLTDAQTMSFFVVAAAVLSNGDTVTAPSSNTAVAVWNNNAGHGIITLLFTSTPVEDGMIGKPYSYQVVTISSDTSSVITYSLVQAPDGMIVDSTTGMITWTPLHSGSFVVNVEASDNHGNNIHQEYTITVGSGDEFTSVSGTITDVNTKTGIGSAQLTFTLVDTTSTIVRSFTANCTDGGMFTINLPAGVFIVDAAAQGYYTTYLGNTQSAPGTLLTVILGTKDTVNIAMKPLIKGDLIGKVMNAATDAPVAGATVTAVYQGTGHDSIGIAIPGYGAQFTERTDDNGNYTMQVHAGLYLVRADANGYGGEWYLASDSVGGAQMLKISADGVDTTNFQLQPLHEVHACIISGTVFGAHDSIIAGALVTITMVDHDGRGNDSLYSLTITTNAKGQYKDTVTCGETYIVFAHKDGFVGMYWRNGHGPLDADRLHIENSVDGVNFVLLQESNSSTVISGAIYGCDSVRSPQFAEVTALIAREGRYIAVATERTDSNGYYSFENLAAGTYVIQAVPANHNYSPGYYTDLNQCTTDWHDAAKIQLTGSAQISGLNIFLHQAQHHPGYTNIGGIVRIVGGSSSTGLSGAIVSAYDVSGNLVDYGVADSSGYYTIADMNIGAYTLSMDRVNYSTVLEGSATTDYELNANASTEVDAQLDGIATDVAGSSIMLPGSAILSQNYPNPFTGSTDIYITFPAGSTEKTASLKVFNALGKQVADLTGEIHATAGNKNINTVSFNAEDLPAGVYFYRLQGGQGQTMTKQMLLVR